MAPGFSLQWGEQAHRASFLGENSRAVIGRHMGLVNPKIRVEWSGQAADYEIESATICPRISRELEREQVGHHLWFYVARPEHRDIEKTLNTAAGIRDQQTDRRDADRKEASWNGRERSSSHRAATRNSRSEGGNGSRFGEKPEDRVCRTDNAQRSGIGDLRRASQRKKEGSAQDKKEQNLKAASPAHPLPLPGGQRETPGPSPDRESLGLCWAVVHFR